MNRGPSRWDGAEGVGREFRRHAARFGFIERYRAGEEPVTGIAAEPWHFRFIGVHAPVVERLGFSLETYVEHLRRETSAKRPLRSWSWDQLVDRPRYRSASPSGRSVRGSDGR